jgi:hypothetical protein
MVLSLSSRPDSLSMWSHYADWHAGLVIGIDVTHPGVARGPFRHLAQVHYLHDRPESRTERHVARDELMVTKSVEWHYEAEWRMLDSCFAAAGAPLAESPDSSPFPLPAEAVRGVITRCRSQLSLIEALDRALASPEYAGVHRFRAETDRGKYRPEHRSGNGQAPLRGVRGSYRARRRIRC